MTSRRLFLLLSLAVVLAAVFGSLSIAATRDGEDSLYKHLSVFTEVVNLARRAYVEEPPMDALMAGALDGAADALDPFATFVPVDGVERFAAARQRGDGVSGITVAEKGGIAFAARVAPESPGAAAGVLSGDVLTTVDGRSTREMPLWEIQVALAAEPGTELELELLRRGDPRSAGLVLEEFRPPDPALGQESLAGEEEAVDLLRITHFGPGTAEAVGALLAGLAERRSESLVVDVRTAGGDPEVAYDVAGMFVSGELGALYDRSGPVERFRSEGEAVWSGEIVVLVDQASIGPAEILGAVLREGAGARLVGRHTFGFAGRQATLGLSDGSRLLLADGFYSGPDGEPIVDGLEPDLVVDAGSRGFGDRETAIERLTLERALELLAGEDEEAEPREAA